MPENKLWKYLDVIKFLTLVNGELYFARADKFKDKYEGAIPKQNYLHFADMYRRAKLNQRDNASESDISIETNYTRKGLHKGIEKDIRKEFFRKFNERKKKVAISCWHLNQSESAAMWEVYSRAGQGIAVCTTLQKLHKIRKPNGYEMEMFKVDYIDFDKTFDSGFTDYELLPFKNKRKEFEYEHEFRIMLYQKSKEHTREGNEPEGDAEYRAKTGTDIVTVDNSIPPVNSTPVNTKQGEPQEFISALNYLPEEGIRIGLNTSELIDEIIASPEMKKYEVAEIQKILDLINRLKGTNFKIKRSRLYENLHY